jgi:hypothetical protein
MLAGSDHFFDEVNKGIAEDEARYHPQEESGYLHRFMRENPARPFLAGGTESPPIPIQIEPGRDHWVRSQAATGELRFSRTTERPIPLRNRNIGKVQAARPSVHLQPEDFVKENVRYSNTNCKRCLEQGAKGKRRMSEEIVCVREGFCTYAEVAIRMDYRRWATYVYKKRQKICIGGLIEK